MTPKMLALNYQLTQIPIERREELTLWHTILEAFDAAGNKAVAETALREQYAPVVSFSTATLYRKLAAWRREGLLGLLPPSQRRHAIEDAAPLPPDFLRFWMGVCARNQRKTAPAWRSLIDDHLRAGRTIPGYGGDWRAIWRGEHPDWALPDDCPYSRAGNCLPAGWSQRNLHRYALNAYQAAAARQGTAAAREYLPTIPTTRVGLPFCRVFIIDDVEHDVLVTFLGNMQPQGVVELGALELLTAHYCSWGAKPVRERADGTREKLREDYTRYLMAYICCRLGFSTEGCLIAGEHGTARLPTDLRATLDRLTGGLVEFAAGGILNKPIARDLYLGLRRGNWRFKAALESHHNLKKNELAAMPGQKGADPEHAPEDLISRTQEHRALMKACVALAESRPDLIDHIRSPFPPYHQYIESTSLLYDRIAERTEHALEGWDELGFHRGEWRLPGDPTWKPSSMLDEMDSADAHAIRGVIERNPGDCWRIRRMSPIEAFAHCRAVHKDKLVRLPDYAVPEIIGPSLADRAEVQPNAVITIPDRYVPHRAYQVAAQIVFPDGRVDTLQRGASYMVWLNPFDGRSAHVATADGVYLGTAPVMVPGTKIDTSAWHRNVAILNAMEGRELKRLAPVADERLRERAARSDANVKALTGREPRNIIAAIAGAAETSAEADDAILELYGTRTGHTTKGD